MKPPHADPSHANHAHYNPEIDDYPDHEAPWEDQWRAMGGVDVDGKMWLTPRMGRNAARLAESMANAGQHLTGDPSGPNSTKDVIAG